MKELQPIYYAPDRGGGGGAVRPNGERPVLPAQREVEGSPDHSRREGLTNSPQTRYPRSGERFMDEGQAEHLPQSPQSRRSTVGEPRPSPVPPHEAPSGISPFTKPFSEIGNPDLRQRAGAFEQRLKEKPFKEWKTDELKDEYRSWLGFTRRLATNKPTEKEQVAGDAHPYQYSLIDELGRREREGEKVGLREFLVEAAQEFPQTERVAPGAQIPPGAVALPPIDASRFRRTAIRSEMNKVAFRVNRGLLDIENIEESENAIITALAEGRTNERVAGEAIDALEMLKAQFRAREMAARAEIEKERAKAEEERGLTLYLMPKDIEGLREDPIDWLNRQFNFLYKNTRPGQEFSSVVVQNVQNNGAQAMRFIQYVHPERLDEFQSIYNTRFNLMFLRAGIGHRNIDFAKERSVQLGAHGLLHGLHLEGGKVGAMFNRACELLEDTRLAEGGVEHHVRAEMIKEVKEGLMREQFTLATKDGIGVFAPVYQEHYNKILDGLRQQNPNASEELQQRAAKEEAEALTEDAVTRTINTAYDVFVSSQREGIIVARGKELYHSIETFLSDPGTMMNVFNLEALLTSKFYLFNVQQEEFLKEIKLAMANKHFADMREKAKKNAKKIAHITKKAQREGRQLDAGETEEINTLKRQERELIEASNRKLTEQEKEDLGRRLFRDIYAVPDFFSSSWRMRGILNQIGKLMPYKYAINKFKEEERARLRGQNPDLADEELERRVDQAAKELSQEEVQNRIKGLTDEEQAGVKSKAGDFGLFFQLRVGRESQETRRQVWEKIARYRPEEVIRLFRERADGELTSLYEQWRQDTNDNTYSYDTFKKEYGARVRVLREQALREDVPEQVDLEYLQQNRDRVIKVLVGNRDPNMSEAEYNQRGQNEYNKFTGIFGAMKTFIDTKQVKIRGGEREMSVIGALAEDDRFEDIYTRVQVVDDAFLDELEDVPKNSGMIPISEIWTAATEVGGDALVRNFRDIGNAAEAGKALVKFIQEEKEEQKIQAAEAFSENASQYAGVTQKARINYFTIGTYYKLTKLPLLADALGIKKLWFRMPMTRAEQIWGPQALTMEREDLLKRWDQLRNIMVGAADRATADESERLQEAKDNPIRRAEIEAEIAQNKKERVEEAKQWINDLRGDFDVTPMGMAKQKGLILFLFALIFALSHTVHLGKHTTKEQRI